MSTMRAMLHAVTFFLLCVGAYYITLVFQAPTEELSLKKHSENSHDSQEALPYEPASLGRRPSEPFQDATVAPDVDVPELPIEADVDVPEWPIEAAVDVPELPIEAAVDIPEWPIEAAVDVLEWPIEAAVDVPEWPIEAAVDVPERPTEADVDVPELPIEVPQSPEEETLQPNPLARGWGEDIDWVDTYGEALRMAQTRQKPLMIIHHLEECPVCTDLKASFSGNEEIQKMAKEDFVMFNLMHETSDPNLSPDGYYVPRIIFVDPTLVIRTDITGKGQQHKYSYAYSDVQLLAQNMKKARTPHTTEL